LGGAVRTLGVRVRKRDWEEGVGGGLGGASVKPAEIVLSGPKFCV
jgi:hypothetical protein